MFIKIELVFLDIMGIGDWGLGLGIVGWGPNPIPKPPPPNPQSPIPIMKENNYYKNRLSIIII